MTLFRLILMLIIWGTALLPVRGEFVLSSPGKNAVIVLDSREESFVRKAAEDLVSDVKKITGQTLKIMDKEPKNELCLIIKTIPTDRPEEYSIRTLSDTRLEIVGSDAHGTMFGIYEFLDRFLEVDPLYFWKSIEPKHQTRLAFHSIHFEQKSPTVRFRGWFINDEDLLTKWRDSGGRREIDYPFYSQTVHPEVMKQIAEALVRSRYNMIIPGSFIDIMNPPEEELVRIASERGIWISQHHIEPVGVSAFTFFNYWKKKNGSKPLFSWYASKKELLEVWELYVEKWSRYPNVIWQIGLRGIADRPMWMADPSVPQSEKDRGALISEAMKTQADLIRKYDKRSSPPMTATLWMEGSALLKKGFLDIPPNAIFVFADNCPGWKMQDDFYLTPRNSTHRFGIYYHHQLWGSGPHLAQGISPRRTETVLRETLVFPARDLMIFNVSNIREFVLGIDATGKMLWDLDHFNSDLFLNDWCRRNFGPFSQNIQKEYESYFSSFAVHPQTKTPFLLDGQLASLGSGLLRLINKNINRPNFKIAKEKTDPVKIDLRQDRAPLRSGLSKKTGSSTDLKNDQKARKKMTADQEVVHVILSDMHPRNLGLQKNLFAARYQKEQFNAVLRRILSLLPENQKTAFLFSDMSQNTVSTSLADDDLSAPEQSELKKINQEQIEFLKTNLIAPALLMSSLSEWCEEIILARIYWGNGDRTESARHLHNALGALKRSDRTKLILTAGPRWENWYRGEEKLNLNRLKDLTAEVYEKMKKQAKPGRITSSL